jgi:hypothetical protein
MSQPRIPFRTLLLVLLFAAPDGRFLAATGIAGLVHDWEFGG